MKKRKITEPGQACRKCNCPVRKAGHPPGWAPKPGRSWFAWWLHCDHCGENYMIEAARQMPREDGNLTLFDAPKKPAPDTAQVGIDFAERLYYEYSGRLDEIPCVRAPNPL